MASFDFRLKTVLKLREAERRQRRLELAQAHEADRILQEQIEGLAAEMLSVRQSARLAAAPGDINVDRLLELQRYGMYVQVQTQGLRQKQLQVQEEIERRRNILVEADRQVRTLEKLREQQEETFRLQEQKSEQKVLDEVGGRQGDRYDA